MVVSSRHRHGGGFGLEVFFRGLKPAGLALNLEKTSNKTSGNPE
jgi:hypothetical protein